MPHPTGHPGTGVPLCPPFAPHPPMVRAQQKDLELQRLLGDQALDLAKGWLGHHRAMTSRSLVSACAALAYHLASRWGSGGSGEGWGLGSGRSLGEEYADLLLVDAETLDHAAPWVWLGASP